MRTAIHCERCDEHVIWIAGVNDTDAKRFIELTYQDVLARKLGVMDMTAIALCMENSMPIVVFDLNVKGNIYKAVTGRKIGTFIRG